MATESNPGADLLIFRNGKIIRAQAAGLRAFDQARDYGYAVFEGVRVYRRGKRAALLRAEDHAARLLRGLRFLQIAIDLSVEDIITAMTEVVRTSPSISYLRPCIFLGLPTTLTGEGLLHTVGGVLPNGQPEFFVIGDDWRAYFGPDVYEHGFGAIIGPYARPNPNVGNTSVKGPGNYAVAGACKRAAANVHFKRADGTMTPCADALMCTEDGFIAEFTGAIPIVRTGDRLRTPPLSDRILPSITRQTILAFAYHHGVTIHEERIPLGDALTADEVLAVGTAAEVSPNVWLMGWTIGDGRPGETFRLIKGWFDQSITEAFEGHDPFRLLTFV